LAEIAFIALLAALGERPLTTIRPESRAQEIAECAQRVPSKRRRRATHPGRKSLGGHSTSNAWSESRKQKSMAEGSGRRKPELNLTMERSNYVAMQSRARRV
jgi:hypothetical protein